MNYGDSQNTWIRTGQPGPQQAGIPQQGMPAQHMQQGIPQQRMMMGAGPHPGQMVPTGQMGGGQMGRPMYGMPPGMQQPMQQPGSQSVKHTAMMYVTPDGVTFFIDVPPGINTLSTCYTQQQQQQQAMIHHQNVLHQIFRQLPPQAQQQISCEPDSQKRTMLIKKFHQHQQQQQQMQHMQQQQAAAAAAAAQQQQQQQVPAMSMSQRTQGVNAQMIVRQTGTQPPGYAQNMSSMNMQQHQQHPGQGNQQIQRMAGTQGVTVQPGIPMSMHSNGPMSVPSAAHPTHSMSGPNSLAAPHQQTQQLLQQPLQQQQQQQPVASPQVSALQAGSGAIGASPATLTGQSPAANPRTPGQGPHSVGTAPNSQQAPASQEEPPTSEYFEKLKVMKEKHYEDLKRIFERSRMDNLSPPKGLERLMEVMEEKRIVTLALLEKLYFNVGTLVERQSLTYPLLEALRSIEAKRNGEPLPSVNGVVPEITVADPKNFKFPDPWGPVRHLMIRVPDHVRALYTDVESSTANDIPVSRKRIAPKEEDPVLNTKEGIYEMECERASKMAKVEETVEAAKFEKEQTSPPISFPCMFDGRVEWVLSPEATRELNGAKWRVDSDHAPAGHFSPDVLICLESELLMCCPLRILLPKSYPTDPAVILYDRSFPASAPLSSQLEALFRRRIALLPERSLTAIQTAWRDACEQQLRLDSGAITSSGPCLMPSNQSQQQLVV